MDDNELIRGVVAQEIGAFEALYRGYRPRLARFIRGLVRQPALADEVLDDTMLVVWSKAWTFDRSCKLSTWIFAIAYRQALHAQRRQGPSPPADDEDVPGAPEAGPEAQLQQMQLREHMADALHSLSAEHRAVIELTYYHGHSCREIAQITDCPVATVKTRMFYARQKLRALLGERGVQAR